MNLGDDNREITYSDGTHRSFSDAVPLLTQRTSKAFLSVFTSPYSVSEIGPHL